MNKIANFPIGNAVKMSQQYTNPYPVFEQMLLHEPVSWIPEIGMWYITRRDDVLRILADTDTFTVVSDKSLMRQAMGYNMLTTDGTEQTRLRRPFNTSFAPHGIRHHAEPFIRSLAENLIASFAHKDVVDIKADFADIIAIQTVLDMLGLDVADYGQIRRWVSDFAQIMSNFAGDPTISNRGQQSVQEFSTYVQSRLEELKAEPDDSILGLMIAEGGHHLTDAELIDAVRVIIFGGVETTSALITNTLYCLLTYPDQLQAVYENPDDRLPNAVEETLRFESPVQTCTRHVLRDVDVADTRLSAGDTLQCMLGAANRDPSHYENANHFDISRENARNHLAYANGKHYCIGAGLARMEAVISLNVLLTRFSNLRLAYPHEDVPVGYEFRSPHHLHLLLHD